MINLASPADPSGIPFTSFGPYTFLVVIAWLLWYAAKEYRKGRAEEVDAHKEEAIRQRARADAIEVDLNRQMGGLKSDLENLQKEVETLRDSHIKETARAHAKTERWMQGYFHLRTLLIEQGINPGPPPEDINHDAPEVPAPVVVVREPDKEPEQ